MAHPTGMTVVEQRIHAAREGRNEKVIARMASGWAVLGDWQYFRGYALLLADPIVPSLNDLPQSMRETFLLDMAALGDAVIAATGAIRCNYSIFCNVDPVLHAHVHPRHSDEPAEQAPQPVWLIPGPTQGKIPFDAAVHGDLMSQIRQHLQASGRLTS